MFASLDGTMSNDTAMLSDDDRPLGVGATSKGAVTNGHSNGQNGDVAMSDDEDMPLVCWISKSISLLRLECYLVN